MRLSRRAAGPAKVAGAVVAGAMVVAGAGILWQMVCSRRDRRNFPPPGKLVDVGGRELHLLVAGSGGPVVVLESGIAASSLSWQRVQPELAKFTTVCSYDRAGLGWSDSGGRRFGLRDAVADLRAGLFAAGLQAPFVLVGHSFGGLIVRAYAAWHPAEIAGVVLVDPVLPAEWIDVPREKTRLLAFGVMLSRRGALMARLGIVRFSLRLLLAGRWKIPQYIARLSSGPGSGVIERLVGEVRKLPAESWPVVQAHWSHPKSFTGMAAHLESLPGVAAEVQAVSNGEVALTILSASNATPEQVREWDRLAANGCPGKHVRSKQGGHWLHLDEPDLVVAAVHEMVDGVRR